MEITVGKRLSWRGGKKPGPVGVAVIMSKDGTWAGQVVNILGQAQHGGSRLVLPRPPLPALVLTLQTGSDGVVHGPADQRHDKAQQDQEDPVFTDPGH